MRKRVTVMLGAVVALVLVLNASPSLAQVTITYGMPYSSQYRSYEYLMFSIPSNQVYNSVPSYRYPFVTHYRQSAHQHRVPNLYSRGYQRSHAVPHQPYSPYQINLTTGVR